MIERVVIENFKSFRKVDLKLGRLNLFIGANASGKSNFFDALRVLGGIAGGFPLKELFEGGARTVAGGIWPGIRGGLADSIFWASGHDRPKPLSVYPRAEPDQPCRQAEASLRIAIGSASGLADYRIAFSSNGFTTRENLRKQDREIFVFDGFEAYLRRSDGMLVRCNHGPVWGSQLIFAFQTALPGEHEAFVEHKDFVETWRKHLLNMQFLELRPVILRGYGAAADIQRMGERGENFASLVRHICRDPKRKKAYQSWLAELRPREVDDVIILSGAVGEALFALQEVGRTFAAPALSEGTLRFAAMTAALFQPEMPNVLAIEQIENGIYGSRLRLLVELLRSQSVAADTQVLATSHSPLVLAWLKPEEFETTFLCRRDEETGETRIVPLTQIPHFQEIIETQSIAELAAEGWFETAI
jgi:predicted ATPase